MTADEFCLRLLRDCAVPRGGHVLVAVSGGADSTALLCFFCEVRDMYPLTLSCAHVEHGIRGEASWRDMEFVHDLCGRLGVPFYGAHVDAPGMPAAVAWRMRRAHCDTILCKRRRRRSGRTASRWRITGAIRRRRCFFTRHEEVTCAGYARCACAGEI